ncbi:E3 SUMO-protein ligase NSE2-like [Centruroides vittatus]|uniref:E3 SUMO-protein ligase NSE2-like n=1 Tax=Centruroides vittatus TaxID=120091 RepID=UPI0035107C3B
MSSLSVIGNELSNLSELEKIISNGKNITIDIAQDLSQINKKESSVDMLKQLEDCMIDFLNLENEMLQFQEAAEQIRQKLASKDSNENFDIDATLQQAVKEISKNNTDMALKQHPSYQKLKTIINQCVHQKINGEQELCEDDDAIIVKQSSGMKDPITQLEIKDPVKNIYCNHVYDKTSILNYMRRREKKCPYIGCTNPHPLQQKDLI